MAFETPGATPEVMVSDSFDSPFNSKSLIITVGPTKIPFSVHEAKLAATSFFETHCPLSVEAKAQLRAASNNSTQGAVQPNVSDAVQGIREVKLEDGSRQTTSVIDPDYHIEDRFFLDPAAFDVFVKFLYNEIPTRPHNRRQVKTLLQAYGIAMNYKCYGLQNKILDCFRAYYARTNIKLDDLVWASNRFGDHTECSLNAYFVEQVAFEIADRGLADFAQNNGFTRAFLEQGDRVIRGYLFEALACYAQNVSTGDPAVGRKKFHVHETGNLSGQRKG